MIKIHIGIFEIFKLKYVLSNFLVTIG